MSGAGRGRRYRAIRKVKVTLVVLMRVQPTHRRQEIADIGATDYTDDAELHKVGSGMTGSHRDIFVSYQRLGCLCLCSRTGMAGRERAQVGGVQIRGGQHDDVCRPLMDMGLALAL